MSVLNITGPRKTQKTFTQKLNDSFATFCGLLPFDTSSYTPTSHLFSRVPRSTLILLIGLDGCGNTTLLREYLSPGPDSVQTHTSRVGVSLQELQVGPAIFQAYDIGGCRSLSHRQFDEELFKKADAVVYMVDAADRDRVMEAREELLYYGLRANHNRGMRPSVPLLVLATKIDLEVF